MIPHARIVIDSPNGGPRFLTGVLYDELADWMHRLYTQGKAAVAFDSQQTALVVGEADPKVPDRWWARDTPPLRDTHTTSA